MCIHIYVYIYQRCSSTKSKLHRTMWRHRYKHVYIHICAYTYMYIHKYAYTNLCIHIFEAHILEVLKYELEGAWHHSCVYIYMYEYLCTHICVYIYWRFASRLATKVTTQNLQHKIYNTKFTTQNLQHKIYNTKSVKS